MKKKELRVLRTRQLSVRRSQRGSYPRRKTHVGFLLVKLFFAKEKIGWEIWKPRVQVTPSASNFQFKSLTGLCFSYFSRIIMLYAFGMFWISILCPFNLVVKYWIFISECLPSIVASVLVGNVSDLLAAHIFFPIPLSEGIESKNSQANDRSSNTKPICL